MKYHYWIGALLLLCSSALFADQSSAMQELNQLISVEAKSTLATCTDPNPPCPAGVGCAGKPSNICADGTQCLTSETCCSLPAIQGRPARDFCTDNTEGGISDCCIVGGGLCHRGSLCQYTEDAQGNKSPAGCSTVAGPTC